MKNIGKKNFTKMKFLMERMDDINHVDEDAKKDDHRIRITESINGKTYGIIKEQSGFIIKESSKMINIVLEDFNYIGGVQNKSRNTYESYNKALNKLQLTLKEEKYVMKQAAPQPKFNAPPAEDVTDDVDVMGDESIDSDTMGDEGDNEFKERAGAIIGDFVDADIDDKKWLLNSLISKMVTPDDKEAIDSAQGKLNDVEDEDGEDGEDGMGDMGGLDESYVITESMSKSAFMSKMQMSPFTETPKNKKEPKLTPEPKLNKGVKGKKPKTGIFGSKSTPNVGQDFKGNENGAFSIPVKGATKGATTKKAAHEEKSGDAKKAKTVFQDYVKPVNVGKVFENSNSPFGDTKDTLIATEKNATAFREEIWGVDVVNAETKYEKESIGIERYGSEKTIFQDETARNKTSPKTVVSNLGKPKVGYVQDDVVFSNDENMSLKEEDAILDAILNSEDEDNLISDSYLTSDEI